VPSGEEGETGQGKEEKEEEKRKKRKERKGSEEEEEIGGYRSRFQSQKLVAWGQVQDLWMLRAHGKNSQSFLPGEPEK